MQWCITGSKSQLLNSYHMVQCVLPILYPIKLTGSPNSLSPYHVTQCICSVDHIIWYTVTCLPVWQCLAMNPEFADASWNGWVQLRVNTGTPVFTCHFSIPLCYNHILVIVLSGSLQPSPTHTGHASIYLAQIWCCSWNPLMYLFYVVMNTGNPWAKLELPMPAPAQTHTHT